MGVDARTINRVPRDGLCGSEHSIDTSALPAGAFLLACVGHRTDGACCRPLPYSA